MNNLVYNIPLLFFSLLFTITIPTESTETPPYSCITNNKTGNNTRILKNIDNLLLKLVSGTTRSGFITASSGENEAQVYGLAQCRGDVSEPDCTSCIQNTAKIIRDLCPTQSDVRVWPDHCFLRYNTNNFFGGVDSSGIYLYNTNNVTDDGTFSKKLGRLMGRISSEAVKPVLVWLGKGKSKISDFRTLYALVQCTRDLSDLNCSQCLAIAIDFPSFCIDKEGCRVLFGSCYVRYELYPFFYPLDSRR